MSHLDSGKDAEAIELVIERTNAGKLSAEPSAIQTIRLDRTAAVIGNPEILQTRVPGLPRPFPRVNCVRHSRSYGNETCPGDFPLRLIAVAGLSRRRSISPAIFAQFGRDKDRVRGRDKALRPRGSGNFLGRLVLLSPLSLGARRYSFRVQPRCSARLRRTMLCSLLPVK